MTIAHVRTAFGEGVATDMESSRLTTTSHREGNWTGMGRDGIRGWLCWKVLPHSLVIGRRR